MLSQCAGPNADGLCRTGTFHCPYAGTCIPVHVRCDTLPNCGLDDNSDERHCQREDVVTNLIEECEFCDYSSYVHMQILYGDHLSLSLSLSLSHTHTHTHTPTHSPLPTLPPLTLSLHVSVSPLSPSVSFDPSLPLFLPLSFPPSLRVDYVVLVITLVHDSGPEHRNLAVLHVFPLSHLLLTMDRQTREYLIPSPTRNLREERTKLVASVAFVRGIVH